jgi:hypothetical protein
MALTEWVPAMRALVGWLGDEDLRTSEALCVRAVGDFTAGMVLHRLLLWMPKATREDGAIWKSDREWMAELGLSYWQMKKVREKLSPVMQQWKAKARGAPTWHYQIRAEALLAALARAAMRSVTFIKAWFARCVGAILQNGFSLSVENGFSRIPSKSITTESTTDSKISVSDFLIAHGVNQAEAEKLGWLPMDVVREQWRVAKVRARPGKAGGYLLAMLREWAKKNPTPPQPLPVTQGGAKDQEQGEMGLYRWEGSFPTQAERPKTLPEEIVPGSARAAWESAMRQLEIQLDRVNFDSWLRDATLVASMPPSRFVVAARSQFARDVLEHRLGRSVKRVLGDVVGSPVEIVWVAREAMAG